MAIKKEATDVKPEIKGLKAEIKDIKIDIDDGKDELAALDALEKEASEFNKASASSPPTLPKQNN